MLRPGNWQVVRTYGWIDIMTAPNEEDGPFFIPLRGSRGHSSAPNPAPNPAPSAAPSAAPTAAKPARPVDVNKLTVAHVVNTRDGEWSSDDYEVFEGHRPVGRITLSAQAPQGMPWFWVITARPDSSENRGYAVSREQAMKELRARWANPSKL